LRRALPLLFVCAVWPGDAAAEAVKTDAPAPFAGSMRIVPSYDGHVGAWLLLGPFDSASHGIKPGKGVTIPDPLTNDPPKQAESALPAFSAWSVIATNAGALDVKNALKANGSDLVAYAAGTLHLARAEKIIMLLGSDDGVRVSVDGKVVLLRDEARPQRDDDDNVVLDLAAGDHPILFKLHQRDGAWSFRVRFVDERLAPPDGAFVELPDVDASRAGEIAQRMARGYASLDTRGDAYFLHVHARFTEGAPIGASLHVKAAALVASAAPLFEIDAGEATVSSSDVDVQLPAIDTDLAAFEDKDVHVRAEIAGREVKQTFHPRKSIREVVKRADEIVSRVASGTRPSWLRDDTIESLQNARNRLAGAQNRGDTDVEALTTETRELATAIDALEHDKDPYATRTGAMRMAYRSPIDNALAEYGLYVPPSWTPSTRRKYPLIIALHGLNGRPLAMMRYFFGGDDPKKESDWEDRHFDPFVSDQKLEAFVVTPTGHGNTMYRDLGEDDPMRVVERIVSRFPIDENRISITGPSMGGIGAASIPFRHPDRFAAAMPLCGYHSYFVRRDINGRPLRPWERVLAEERSNVDWALNGWGLPLFIVHGTKDLPIENSGILIDAYEKMHYSVEHEHPELGHNVWQTTYENLKGAKWLIDKRRDPHPRRVRFRTVRLRDGKSYWVHIDELAGPDVWGQVDARVTSRTSIGATTSGVAELAFDRDAALLDDKHVTVAIDGQTLAFDDAIVMHKDGTSWATGPAKHDGPWKRGELTGPIRDAFHAPLTFVWGASDPAQARANEEVARAWAAIRYGVSVRYPILSDGEFFARGETVGNDRPLFLVGNAKSNQVLRALEGDLPIKIDGDAITMGQKRFTGEELGAAFIRPNPRRTDRYLVVVEGTTAIGTWRSLSLPDLLPDFVIWDKSVAPARGQMLLSAGALLAGGFFKNDWSLPDKTDDPLAQTIRPGAKSEYDATPYLP
jgi:predicted esterase